MLSNPSIRVRFPPPLAPVALAAVHWMATAVSMDPPDYEPLFMAGLAAR